MIQKHSSLERTSLGYYSAVFCLSASFALLSGVESVSGVEQIVNGFSGIRWGTNLSLVDRLRRVETAGPIETYELKEDIPRLGNATISTLKFVAIQGMFARVVVHYSGAENHKHMLTYLQGLYGAIEQAPGSMMRGLNQEYDWRVDDTEVGLTYHSFQERGTVFIESRTLAPRFNDLLPDTAY